MGDRRLPSLGRTRRGAARGACALASLLLLACPATSSAAAAKAKDKPGVEIIAGEEARTVQLQVCPRPAGAEGEPRLICKSTLRRPYLGGMLTVQIRSTAGGIRTPTVSYRLAGRASPIPLFGQSRRALLIGDDGKPLKKGMLKTRGTRPLRLSVAFAVPADEAASALDGTLRVSIEGGEPAELPVNGEARTYSGVTVAPDALTVDSSEDSAKLALEGPELIEYLRSHGGEELRALLYDDGGDTANAMLTLPTAADALEEDEYVRAGTRGEYRVESEVKLTHPTFAAGKFSGKLVLPGLPTEANSVAVELHAHWSFWVTMLAVLLGIAVTGVGTRIVTMAGRRRLLTSALEQTYSVFVYVVRRPGEIASWHLDDLLGEDPTEGEPMRTPPAGRLQGLPALWESVATARSSADLDEDATRVLDMVARMQRWLRVEPVARRLVLLRDTVKGKPKLPDEGKAKPQLAWRDSRTLRDTMALLEMAQREPADADKADELVARMLFQARWHNGVAALWRAAAQEASKPGAHPRIDEVRALEAALDEESKATSRELDDQDALAARLEALLAKHSDDVTVEEIGPIDGEGIDECGRRLGVTPVIWDASSNLFTGWATLDAKSYGQLARRAATSSRVRYMPDTRAILREAVPDRADLAWTAVILVFASAAYSTTVYDDTWGGCADLATAFLAGFAGKITIDWAALPIFQSIRLRKAEAD